MDEVLREEAISLIALGYFYRNKLSLDAADHFAERLLDKIEQSQRLCSNCGAKIDDADVLLGTIWA